MLEEKDLASGEERRIHLVGDFGSARRLPVGCSGLAPRLHPAAPWRSVHAARACASVFSTMRSKAATLRLREYPAHRSTLEIKDGGNIFHRGASEHFTGQVEHDHSGREALATVLRRALVLALQAVLQVIDERRAVDGALIVKRQAEVLGERALTGAVEAGNPDAHLVFTN